MRRASKLIVVLTLAMLLAVGLVGHSTAGSRAPLYPFIKNGTMQDRDRDGFPDQWLPFTESGKSAADQVACSSWNWCEFRFANAPVTHGIHQWNYLPYLDHSGVVTFRFHASGLIPSGSTASAILTFYPGGILPDVPNMIKTVELPNETTVNQSFSLTFEIPTNTRGVDVYLTASPGAVWGVTSVSMTPENGRK